MRMSAVQRQEYSVYSPPNPQGQALGLAQWGTQTYLLDDMLDNEQ